MTKVYAVIIEVAGVLERPVSFRRELTRATQDFSDILVKLKEIGGKPYSDVMVAEDVSGNTPCFGRILLHLLIDFPYKTVTLSVEAWSLDIPDEKHIGWLLNEVKF